MRRVARLASIAPLLCLASGVARPQPVEAPAPDPRDTRLEALEETVRILARKLEIADEKFRAEVAERAVEKKKIEWFAAPGRGFGVATGDGRFSANLRARAQIRDTVTVQDGKRTTNEINVKTVRLWLTGHVLTKDLTYGLQLAFGGNDFESGSSSPLFDLFIDYARLRDLNIRVGQFFVPFDRARTIREFALQFTDRQQIITELTLDRDVGVAFSSTNLFGSKILGYHLGLFGGEGRNKFGGQRVGFLYTLRFVLRPFGLFDDDSEGDLDRLRRVRLAIGVAGALTRTRIGSARRRARRIRSARSTTATPPRTSCSSSRACRSSRRSCIAVRPTIASTEPST